MAGRRKYILSGPTRGGGIVAMKAMLLENFGQPLKYRDVPDPAPGYGEVVLDVEACGVCHSDLKIVSGLHPNCSKIQLPFIPGHEIAGRVCSVGEGVKEWKKGDRALVSIYMGCLQCESCRAGAEQLCESEEQRIIGFSVNGGYAQKVKVRERNLVRLSEKLPGPEAAVITDAIGTSWRAAFEAAQVTGGQKALVIGLGGLGVHLAQILNAAGLDVEICEACREKLSITDELGLDKVFCRYANDMPRDKKYDVIFDVTGKIMDYDDLLSRIKRRGKLIMIGYSVDSKSSFLTSIAHVNEISLIGTRGYSVKNLKDALDMVERGKIRPVVGAVHPLEDANEVLRQLKEGYSLCGRLVLVP